MILYSNYLENIAICNVLCGSYFVICYASMMLYRTDQSCSRSISVSCLFKWQSIISLVSILTDIIYMP